jgi:chemotaxis protein CheD
VKSIPRQPLRLDLPRFAEDQVIELMPGDVRVGLAGLTLTTLLGSCVAVLLFDSRETVGAMCHIVHARKAPPGARRDGRYADAAMALMYAGLQGLGVQPRLCQARVYGGGHLFPKRGGSVDDPGARNVAWVSDFLQAEGIPVIEQRTGGHFYRRISWTIGNLHPLLEEHGV